MLKHKGFKHTQEAKKKISIGHQTKENILKSIANLPKYPNGLPETIKRNISKGRLERKKRLGYLNSPKARKKQSDAIKGHLVTEETRDKIRKANLGHKVTMITRRKLQITSKRNWQKPEYREKVIKASLKGLLKRPTSFESIIIKIIQEKRLPYKYVGNGSFLIGWKNPDFIRTDNRKICIEVFYNYFKERNYGSVDQYKKQRSEYFKKWGWETIFINEEEIKNKKVVLKKLTK